MTRSKTAIAIAFLLMFAMTFTLVAVPLVDAHDPPLQIPTYAFINVAPSPVGAGQRDDRTLVDLERDALERLDVAVEHVDVAHGEERAAVLLRRRGRGAHQAPFPR